MNIVISCLLMVVLGFFIVKNVIAIVNNIKEKKSKQVDLLDKKDDGENVNK